MVVTDRFHCNSFVVATLAWKSHKRSPAHASTSHGIAYNSEECWEWRLSATACALWFWSYVQCDHWIISRERHGVTTPLQQACLFNSVFRLTTKNTKEPHHLSVVRKSVTGGLRSRELVTWKAFSHHEVIMATVPVPYPNEDTSHMTAYATLRWRNDCSRSL